MSEEEKEAIEKVLGFAITHINDYESEDKYKYIETVKNLIEKQQKEMVDLQAKLEIEKIDNKYNQEERDEETIPKYKIREKIKELESLSKNITMQPSIYNYEIDLLKELLEE